MRPRLSLLTIRYNLEDIPSCSLQSVLGQRGNPDIDNFHCCVVYWEPKNSKINDYINAALVSGKQFKGAQKVW